jgi:hypothetical protein
MFEDPDVEAGGFLGAIVEPETRAIFAVAA